MGVALSGKTLEEEIEEKVDHVLRGVSEALEKFVREEGLTVTKVKSILEQLEPSFRLLTRKWALTILYALLLAGPASFTALHEATGVNKRSLSQRLRELERHGLVKREVKTEPPITTIYKLTETGRDAALLMIPLIYYVMRRVPRREP